MFSFLLPPSGTHNTRTIANGSSISVLYKYNNYSSFVQFNLLLFLYHHYTHSSLSQSHVQAHHHNESDDGAPGGQLAIATRMCLGQDVIGHNVNHSTGSKG